MMLLVVAGILFFRSTTSTNNQGEKTNRKFPWRRILELTILIAVLAALIFFAGSRNDFFARIWDYWERAPKQGYVSYLINYFEYLGFGARYTYMETAYQIYDQHPLLGVGLGNYAFYFNENLPNRPLAAIPEVLRLVVPESAGGRLITPKNLIIRVSGTKVNGAAPSFWPWTSQVTDGKGKNCPAPEQGGQCKSCRQCWDRSIPNIIYAKH